MSYRSGVDVRHLPMAIHPPAGATFADGRPEGFVFVGGLDYAPNKRAVHAYDTHIAPSLRAAGFKQTALHVIGKCAPKDRAQFSNSIMFHGYVQDLDAALRRFEYLLVPEVAPGGCQDQDYSRNVKSSPRYCSRHRRCWNRPRVLSPRACVERTKSNSRK